MRKCSAVRQSDDFKSIIPVNTHAQIKHALKLTSDTSKEQSLTFCRLRGDIFVSSHVIGESDETIIKPCPVGSEQIGDLHTHPTEDNTTVGITPSTSDIVSTLLDSVNHNIPQISCIAGPNAKYISCYQPRIKVMKNKEKIEGYKKALDHNDSKVTDVPEFIRHNVANDFTHAWYNKNSFKRSVPSPSAIVKDAFTKSGRFLKNGDVPEAEKPRFCKMIQDLNYPTRDNRVSKACERYLN